MASSEGPARKCNVVRRKLADGTIKEYRYERGAQAAPPARLPADSVGAMLLAYKRSPEWAAHAPATKRSYLIYLRELESLAEHPAKNVTRRLLLSMRDAIASCRGNGAATVFIRVAGAVFAWGLEREWIDHMPLQKVKALPGGHLETWTVEEYDEAVRVLPEPLRRAIVLARYTGQRRGDLCRLTWAAYDGSVISLTQQKTGTKLILPVHPVLAAELDAWRRDGALFMLSRADGVPWQPDRLTGALHHALVKLGFRPQLGIHGLRKLMATDLAQHGASTHEIAAVTGHRSLDMVALYTAAVDQERLAGAAIARMQNVSEKIRKTRAKQ